MTEKSIIKCPECGNDDIICTDKEKDGTLTYKCHKCKCKFKINNLIKKTLEKVIKIIDDRLEGHRKQRMTIPNQPKSIIIAIAHQEDELKDLKKELIKLLD